MSGHKFDPRNFEKLDNPERLSVFDPDTLFAPLRLPAGAHVVDIGVGTGFYLPALSRLAGSCGTVTALDTEPAMLEHAARRIAGQALSNVTLMRSAEDELPLERGTVDFALLAFVYHEIENPVALMTDLRRVLKSGGRVCIVEWTKAERDKGPPPDHVPSLETIREHVESCGFVVERVEQPSIYCNAILLTC
ncbi:MAG TPA: methyltransferase domain-containing protein [Candidatus Ozemobacteraceae bacterium]|nr:methyltransferase domain-containing protein [Candidatus Ozemobacteraceae bacterium]